MSDKTKTAEELRKTLKKSSSEYIEVNCPSLFNDLVEFVNEFAAEKEKLIKTIKHFNKELSEKNEKLSNEVFELKAKNEKLEGEIKKLKAKVFLYQNPLSRKAEGGGNNE